MHLSNPQGNFDENQLKSIKGTKYSLNNLLKVVKASLLLVADSKLNPSDIKMGVIIFKILEKKRSSENLPLEIPLIMECLSVGKEAN